ncbi:serpin-ZX-like [Vicia villosa]|uniref:serpin-ZX-like n=1 Tax=Vicia villosa TaxID=3911 RepID=UPI00273BD32E|nr:serpin-ZX-like [Vicia villosa]
MDLGKSSTNQTEVSLTMAKHLFSKEEYKEKNIVFSPLSLQIILSIVAVGSQGSTKHQLLEFLHSDSTGKLKTLCSQLVSYVLADNSSAGGPLVSFVNGVWVQQSSSLKPSFKKSVSTDFKAAIASVDFITKAHEVAKEVNLWAEKETKGLIKNLLPPESVDSLTRLILANALYFKGAWRTEFDISKTKDYDFYLLNGSSVKVPFMTSKDKQYISVFDGFKVLQLSYKGGQSYKHKDRRSFSMYIYLPDAKDGLLALIEKVASDSEFLEHTRPRKSVPVGDFRIPRFNISFDLETSRMLKELGVVLPFSETGGGLTKMVEDSPTSEQLYVSAIYHKSYIELNERGTEAAAVNFFTMRAGCAMIRKPPQPPIDFVADHPFMFLIRENCSGTILFIGQVLNPGVLKKGTEATAATSVGVLLCKPERHPPPIDFVADHPFMFLIREDCSGTVLFIGEVLNPECNISGDNFDSSQEADSITDSGVMQGKRRVLRLEEKVPSLVWKSIKDLGIEGEEDDEVFEGIIRDLEDKEQRKKGRSKALSELVP